MTRRALLFIFAAGVLLALSLALSNALYYFLALTMAFVLLYSFVSALFSFLTLSALSRALVGVEWVLHAASQDLPGLAEQGGEFLVGAVEGRQMGEQVGGHGNQGR